MAPLILVLLGVGTCQGVRYSEKSGIRERLPMQLQGGSFITYDVCSRVWGGYSYAVTINPEVADRIVSQGPDFLEYTDVVSPSRSERWQPMHLFERLRDGNDPGNWGLLCLSQREFEGEPLIDHIYREGSYVTKDRHGSLIIVPSLGVAVGGFDPR